MGRTPLVLISGKDVIDRVGGHASYVRAHALAAARIGFEPHVFEIATREGTTSTDFAVVHRVATPHRHPSPVVLQMPVLARAVARFMSERSTARTIHGFGIWAGAAVAAARSLARRGVPAVPIASAYGTRVYEHLALLRGMGPHHPLGHRLRYRGWVRWQQWFDDPVERRAYLGARLVLVNYSSVERILARACGPGISIRRVPYAAPHAFSDQAEDRVHPPPRSLEPLGPPTAPLVVSVSRHDPRKGLDLMLFALARVAGAGIPFRACLAGDGKLLQAHRRLAGRLGLDGRVVFPGRIPDPLPYLDSAGVFVLPSLAEASGSVSVLEALQAGTPIIASACDGIPEDLTHESDALLVPPGDIEALAGALRRLLTDGPLRQRLAAGARRTYERRFSAERFVAALAQVYDELEAGAATAPAPARIASAT